MYYTVLQQLDVVEDAEKRCKNDYGFSASFPFRSGSGVEHKK